MKVCQQRVNGAKGVARRDRQIGHTARGSNFADL
jgi:hypothetical protein